MKLLVRVSLRAAAAAARRRLGLGSVAAVSWSHIFSIAPSSAAVHLALARIRIPRLRMGPYS